MKERATDFISKSSVKAADKDHRQKINFNIGRYNAVVPSGKQQFLDVNLAREKAKNIKWKAIESLDRQLEKFETGITRRGTKVIWAETADQACEEILKICQEKNCRTLVKSKSMVTEEIHLNAALKAAGVEALETDLGEYIIQLAGETPSHIIAPAIHKTRYQIADLFVEKLGIAPTDDIPTLTITARRVLREKFGAAEMGVSEITVKIHRGHAMKKMGARSLADLVRMAEALEIRRPQP